MRKNVLRAFYVLFFAVVTAALTCSAIYFLNLTGGNGTINKQSDDPDIINAVTIDGQSELTYRNITIEDFTASPYYTTVKVNNGRESLESESEKELYDLIGSSVMTISETKDENDHYRTMRVTINGKHMSERDIRRSINAYVFDNPQVFWLDNLFGYAYADDDTIAEFYSVMSADECEKKAAVLRSAVNMIMSSLEEGQSEFDREKLIHDYIILNCVYKGTAKSLSDGWEYFSAYGVLVKGEAVCEGYAKAEQLLMNLCGIECETIRGDSDGSGHMWNVIKIDGKWYHLDTTWDDTDNGPIYDFFNINDEIITLTHTISPTAKEVSLEDDSKDDMRYNFFIPRCASTEAGYYSRNAAVIITFDNETDKKIVDTLVNAANNRDKYLPIVFGKEMKYEEYIDKLFFGQPYKFYAYVNAANELLDDEHKIDRDGCSIYKNESALLVRVKLAYVAENNDTDQ